MKLTYLIFCLLFNLTTSFQLGLQKSIRLTRFNNVLFSEKVDATTEANTIQGNDADGVNVVNIPGIKTNLLCYIILR